MAIAAAWVVNATAGTTVEQIYTVPTTYYSGTS